MVMKQGGIYTNKEVFLKNIWRLHVFVCVCVCVCVCV